VETDRGGMKTALAENSQKSCAIGHKRLKMSQWVPSVKMVNFVKIVRNGTHIWYHIQTVANGSLRDENGSE